MPVIRTDWIRTVVEEHGRYVGRALRYLGIPERDLPDACQEVFVIVARRQDDLREGAPLRAWLYGIAVNVARNARRTARRRPEELGEPPERSLEAPQEQAVERAQRRREALRRLERLSEEQREVLVLHDVEELPMREITETLGIPLQTGYSRLRLARAALAKAAQASEELP